LRQTSLADRGGSWGLVEIRKRGERVSVSRSQAYVSTTSICRTAARTLAGTGKRGGTCDGRARLLHAAHVTFLKTIELLGTEVLPHLRREIGQTRSETGPVAASG
jgi:hypothetical protein